jgi:hypothetical protein
VSGGRSAMVILVASFMVLGGYDGIG